ncbi:MAG: ferritin family protein [Candidatus Omnitrophica bacterium]|nr:ferritin family protein [Candidatus Omnitrophota bacterium]
MAEQISPQEILKIAIKVEENGEKLYQALEAKAKDRKLKDLWKYLAGQEEEHRKVFSRMLDNITDYIVYEFSPGEYQAYLKAIAASYVFTQGLVEKKINQGFRSDIEALDFAISIEKESILVYTALKDYVITAKQEILDRVINEEKSHFTQLSSLKQSLGRRG